MKYTQEEILNALKIIKETCEETGKCEDCPFGTRDYYGCRLIEDNPGEWELAEINRVTWRALL